MEYHCLEEMNEAVWFPTGKRSYWTHSLETPTEMNKRKVQFSSPESSVTRKVKVVEELIPNHMFQIPCDTIVSSDSCYQNTRMLNLVR